jgi:pimeloyl-ACP methyl ester carboxylesterase
MAKKHSIIYVPGLGDAHLGGQRLLVATWRWWGVEPVVCQMKWGDGEPFAPKLARLLGVIDTYNAKGYVVSLVGSSAGASAVINAFAARKDAVSGVVCIAGKINNPEAIGKSYRRNNPAFVESAYLVQPSLDKLDFEADRSRIQSRYAFLDPVIPKQDSEIAGGRNRMLPSIGHSFTIATQLLLGAPTFLQFLKRPPR